MKETVTWEIESDVKKKIEKIAEVYDLDFNRVLDELMQRSLETIELMLKGKEKNNDRNRNSLHSAQSEGE